MHKRGQSILIVGGGGFIGANLARALFTQGYAIHLIVKHTTNLWRLSDIISHLKIHKVDILDQKKLAKIIKNIKPFAIINLATYSDYRNQQDFEKMIEVNILGLVNLLQASKNIPYNIFINTGSSSEYGKSKKSMKETDALNPISFYAATKASATYICQVFAKEFKKPIVTLRPFSVYGQYEMDDRFIPKIILSLIKREPIKLTEGKQRRDFIYINDLISAYLLALKKGTSLRGEVINVGTGKEHSNDEIVKMLFQVTQKKVAVKKGVFPTRLWDSQHWVADRTKAKKILGWQPKIPLRIGLLKTYRWFVENKYLYEKK